VAETELLNQKKNLIVLNFCFSTYNHSGNFKQHLLKHERESGSISALLVAQAQVTTNNHLVIFSTIFWLPCKGVIQIILFWVDFRPPRPPL